jgi:[calcium/calmodulin-dependent protein kinase] kinase
LHELGRGVHGKVKLCVDTETGEQYALKIVQKKGKKKFGMRADGELDKIKKEIAIMKKLKHPNVVTLFEVIDDPNQEKIYMGMTHPFSVLLIFSIGVC